MDTATTPFRPWRVLRKCTAAEAGAGGSKNGCAFGSVTVPHRRLTGRISDFGVRGPREARRALSIARATARVCTECSTRSAGPERHGTGSAARPREKRGVARGTTSSPVTAVNSTCASRSPMRRPWISLPCIGCVRRSSTPIVRNSKPIDPKLIVSKEGAMKRGTPSNARLAARIGTWARGGTPGVVHERAVRALPRRADIPSLGPDNSGGRLRWQGSENPWERLPNGIDGRV